LRDAGFYDVRVRHHELKGAEGGVRHLARIEVGAGELPKFLGNGVGAKIAAAMRALGYAHVTVDLEGYRRGSVNEAPVAIKRPAS
jgi:uncharacterized protein